MSGRTVNVRLRTLCGCSRNMVFPAPTPQTIALPIQAMNRDEQPNKFRTFRLVRLWPADAAVDADYEEAAD